MWVDHDDTTGRVRLDPEAFDHLVAVVGGNVKPDGPVETLIESGAVDTVLSTMRAPLARLRLQVAGESVVQRHEGWVRREVAGLKLEVHAREYQLSAIEPQFLAAGLARVVRLGPRKVGARAAMPVEADVVDDLFHPDDMRRISALKEIGAGFAWTLAVSWPGGAVTATVVDGEQGAFLVTGDEELTLQPLSPTDLWRRLTTALPADDELAV